ncbi:gamma-glutamyltranspeptidase [Suillus fuscotomentosus]|uniref:Glutathione hydrolase n=1 Tax=Suillus fuscotomentosus TaxID=1912939 RepID=A0AAD4E6R0_9AGAM|nr:gamma-glutamyltranspeptidase [Suillus fuscotomentosus]KAG1900607.1 gamma-glutamyltranspeptidase [Suillus fuscotomentosus]
MDYRKRVSPLPTVEDAPPVDSFKQPFDSTEAELPLYLYTKEPKGRRRWQRGAFVALLAICLATLLLQRYQPHPHLLTRPRTQTRNPAYLIEAEHGAVASENKRCSDIGVTVLREGGNAVDAAISAVFCVGVVNMFSSGIGGGGFMTVRIPPSSEGGSSEVYTIDFRETAPALANSTMYADDPAAARWGGLAVGVPGEVRGLQEAHERWGKLPWTRLVQPSIDLAAGWAVDKELARRLQMFARLILPKEDWRAIFAPEGRMLFEGETIRRTNYSRTLATIASEGPNVFYKGPIADSIIRKVQATGGIMTNGDLENYTVKVDHALQGTYRDKKVYTSCAPTSGPVLLHILNLLERYDFIGEGRTGLNIHRFIEALKFGFAARTKIGDLAYVTNGTARVAEISTKTYADAVALNLTDDRTHTPEYYNPEFDVKIDHGTSHTSVLDKDGMAVALTTTVNLVFGSMVLDPETGIILNDEMDDFSVPGRPNGFGLLPSPYNYPEPGKRPLSSTTPTIIENLDGSFYLSVGGSGGGRIFGAVLQVILNLDWGMDVSAAIENGRVHDQLYPLEVDADEIVPVAILNSLIERGHNITVSKIDRVAAVVQAVVSMDGRIFAASDSRKNGIAAGY